MLKNGSCNTTQISCQLQVICCLLTDIIRVVGFPQHSGYSKQNTLEYSMESDRQAMGVTHQ